MIKRNIFPLIFILFSGYLTAQDINYARETIRQLGSQKFHGRGYIDNGDRQAADFIENEFKNLGLKPISDEYFQYFKFPVNTFPGRMLIELNGIPLLPGKEFLIDPGSPSVKGAFQTVYLKSELLNDFQRLSDTLVDSREKFILIDYRQIPEWNDSVKYAIEFLKYNPAVTARGVIELTDSKLMWSVSTKVNPRPVITITKKLPPDLAGLVYLDIQNEYYPNYTSQNVIASIPGSSDYDSIIMVTAHYDHLGSMGKDTYFPGANDNASGVALMLDLARHYSLKKNRPPYTMIFVAFGGEEAGLLGSRFFVENPAVDLGRVSFLINLDISGTGDEGITVVNGEVHKSRFEELTKINQKYKYLKAVNSRSAACNSDHCFFHEIGIKSFFIYTLGGIQAYHDIYDKSDTLPLTAYEPYFKLLINFIDQIQED